MEDLEYQAAIRAEVRRYLARLVAGVTPVLVLVLALVLLLVLVPAAPTGPSATLGSATQGVSGGLTPSGGAGTSSPSGAGPGPNSAGSAANGATGSAGGHSSFPTGSAPAGRGPGSGSTQSATTTTGAGAAASGVRCTAGARQVTWTPYAPPCFAKWSGNNGGATTHGVTASTITMVLRKPSDWDALKGNSGANFNAIVQDMQTMAGLFNSQYELYGRKVVIKSFNGQGSWTAEASGQDQAGASADAQTAYDLGAFVDGFPITAGTFTDAEVARKIISFAPPTPVATFQKNAPFMYGTPTFSVQQLNGSAVASVLCQRMAKMPAVFAGDATYKGRTRKFAVLEPEQPQYEGAGEVILAQLKACGAPGEYIKYNADISSEAQQAAQIVAKLKADGVTTPVMITDPFMAVFMTQAATQEGYTPEWVLNEFPQSFGRQADASQMAHALHTSPWHATTGKPEQRLCGRIYRLASHGAAPQSDAGSLDQECSLLMAFFAAAQTAGPNLTPRSFQQGWFNVGYPSARSDFGIWSSGPNQYSPDATTSLQQWDATTTSGYDNGKGQWSACGGFVDFPDLGAHLGSGQLSCYGH